MTADTGTPDGAQVLQFATTCPPCREARHDNCWQHLAEVLRYEHAPCRCGCYDEHGDLTHAALVEMTRRQPEALARMVRFGAAIKRSSLRFHLR